MANELENLAGELSKPTERTVARIERFGGLRRDGSPSGRNVPISDCTDCLNVHTAGGGIEVRPGYEPVWTGENGHGVSPLDTTDQTFASGYIDGTPHLFLAYKTLSQVQVLVWAENIAMRQYKGTVFGVSGKPYSPPSVKVYNNVVYVACGGQHPSAYGAEDEYGNVYCSFKMYKKGGVWVRHKVGIRKPLDAAPVYFDVEAMNSGSYLTEDVISYRYTSYNADTDTESEPTSETLVAPVGTYRKVLLHIWRYGPADGDVHNQQPTHIRVYRKITAWRDEEGRDSGGPDSTWYWVGDVEEPNWSPVDPGEWITFEDSGPVPHPNGEVVPTYSDYYSPRGRLNFALSTPPISNAIEAYRNRMWWVEEGTNKVRWSEPWRPEQVYPTNSITAGDAEEEVIAIRKAYDRLFIFKRGSIYYLSGSTPESFAVNLLPGAGKIGCMNANTIVEGPDGLYFADITGIYKLTGSGIQLISSSLRDYLEYDRGAYRRYFKTRTGAAATACFDYIRGLYILSGSDPRDSTDGNEPDGGGVVVSRESNQLVYSLGAQKWYRWNMPFWCMHTWRATLRVQIVGWIRKPEGELDSHTSELRQNGKIARVAGNADISTGNHEQTWPEAPIAIPWHWHIPPSDMRTTRGKQIHYWRMSVDSPGHTDPDSLWGMANTSAVPGEEIPLGLESKNRVGQVMDTIEVKFGGSTQHATAVVAVELDTPEVIGHD